MKEDFAEHSALLRVIYRLNNFTLRALRVEYGKIRKTAPDYSEQSIADYLSELVHVGILNVTDERYVVSPDLVE